jgi:hypothetical protein
MSPSGISAGELSPISARTIFARFPTEFSIPEGGTRVARKTILVCDKCGKEVDEEKGAVLRVTYADARRTSKQADLCETCAGTMPGRAVARRGRRPKAA